MKKSAILQVEKLWKGGESMVNKMTPAFQKAKGGLFETVTKADVGDNVTDLEKNGGQLMSWAVLFRL